MADIDYEGRPVRPCVGCGQRDQAPRDVVSLPDGNTAYYHMDCHVMIADCPTCKAVLAEMGGHGAKGLKNEELVKKLVAISEMPVEKQPKVFTTADASGSHREAFERGEALPLAKGTS